MKTLNVQESNWKDMPNQGLPRTKLTIQDHGDIEFDAQGRPFRITTRYGYTRPNPWLNKPVANAEYRVFENSYQQLKKANFLHIFKTDGNGATETAQVEQIEIFNKLVAGKRWNKNQCAPVGFPGGKYDRGHLIGAQFGGGMEAINLVTMPRSVNRHHKAKTAIKNGFHGIADLMERFINLEHSSKGSLGGSGEFTLPNYQRMESVLKHHIKRKNYDVSFLVEVSYSNSFRSHDPICDVLYCKIFGDREKLYGYKIDCRV